ncbi:MAG: hybrid sensor histidine kinase/response regulator [Paludibacter sp.]|nr:hybrid sensor histidine kinase/response regulator [Paludibacter sp.]
MKALDQYLVLIIDDNPMNLLVAAKSLENYGVKTLTAESGKEGLEMLKVHTPSLILLDIMMPEMDGYEVCRKIKQEDKWKDIPVIFLTANSHMENLVEGFDAGGVDYITKPFKQEELLVRIKNHIELAESKKTIVEMIRSRDKLYSIIAHDVRSPLSGILQTIDAIDQGFIDVNSEDFKEIMHHLRIRTRETNTLLTSLLQWTRLQADTIVLDFQFVNIKQVLHSCIELLGANAQDKKIQINLAVDEDVYAWCDEVSVHTIFRNIISNAIKFTKESGFIEIKVIRKTASVEISVADNGVGMAEETVRKIFRENQHYTSSGTANEQGTGLGLMLVKDFIRKNNGHIEVSSTLNVGTKIVVKLPLEK